MSIDPKSIIYAGYGCYLGTYDVTATVKQQIKNGQTVLKAIDETYGDPAPGLRKYLYLIWKEGEVHKSGVTGEGDVLDLRSL